MNSLIAGADGESGILSLDPLSNNPPKAEDFLDDRSKRDTVLIANPDSTHPNRLAYLSPELAEEVRISGTPEVTIRASIDRPVTNLTALLIDYGGRRPVVVTRGWMDPQNLESDAHSVPLTPNQEYSFTWDMQPHDYDI